MSAEITDTIEQVDRTLRFLARIGSGGFDCAEKTLDTLASWEKTPSPARESLRSIENDLGDCQRCGLAQGRHKIVFGAGDEKADLVFVGEGPGFEEDRQGIPFVGAAGELLTKIIDAIHLTRESVYIGNIVKCRPPGNRNPVQEEIDTCLPFLERQLDAIQPRFICALGGVAAQTLLKTSTPISRLRGRFHDYRGMQLMPTYHPAYLLRNSEKKRDVWEDMKQLIEAMNSDDLRR